MISLDRPSIKQIARLIAIRRDTKWWHWYPLWLVLVMVVVVPWYPYFHMILFPFFLIFFLGDRAKKILISRKIWKMISEGDDQQIVDVYGPSTLTRFEKHQWDVALSEEEQDPEP